MKTSTTRAGDKKLEKYALTQKQTHCECILPPPCSFSTDSNSYSLKSIPPKASNLKKAKEVGSITEKTHWLNTILCWPSWRPYVSEIRLGDQVFEAHKTFNLGYLFDCCPKKRPNVTIFRNGKAMGYVCLPITPACLCNIDVHCYMGKKIDEKMLLYKIKAIKVNCHRCCGTWLPTCDKTKNLKFYIRDAIKEERGSLSKQHNGCYTECCTASDMYML